MPGVVPPQLQDFQFLLVELLEFSLVEMHLIVSKMPWYINHTAQFCIICEPAEVALYLILKPLMEMLNSTGLDYSATFKFTVHLFNLCFVGLSVMMLQESVSEMLPKSM